MYVLCLWNSYMYITITKVVHCREVVLFLKLDLCISCVLIRHTNIHSHLLLVIGRASCPEPMSRLGNRTREEGRGSEPSGRGKGEMGGASSGDIPTVSSRPPPGGFGTPRSSANRFSLVPHSSQMHPGVEPISYRIQFMNIPRQGTYCL